MANKNDEKVTPMTGTQETDENKEGANEMEGNQEAQGKVVQLPTEKKGGFFRDMSIGMKIGMGLFFSGLALGAGYLVKTLIGGRGGNDAAPAEEPIVAEGSVSEPVEG